MTGVPAPPLRRSKQCLRAGRATVLRTPVDRRTAAAPRQPSIAILPLRNAGSDPDQERLADDLAALLRPEAAAARKRQRPPARRAFARPADRPPQSSSSFHAVVAVFLVPRLHVQEPIGPTAEPHCAGRPSHRWCRPSSFVHSSISAEMRSRTTSPTVSPTVSSAILRARCPESPSSPATPRSPIRAGAQTRGRSAASWRSVSARGQCRRSKGSGCA